MLFSNPFRGSRSWPWRNNLLAIVVVGVVVAAVVKTGGANSLIGRGGPADASGDIAYKIGAYSCDQTGYAIINKLDGSRSTIYDCVVGSKEMCVTEDNGLVSDNTAAARLLFASVLSGGKPTCAA
jgi:hypothetical protein